MYGDEDEPGVPVDCVLSFGAAHGGFAFAASTKAALCESLQWEPPRMYLDRRAHTPLRLSTLVPAQNAVTA